MTSGSASVPTRDHTTRYAGIPPAASEDLHSPAPLAGRWLGGGDAINITKTQQHSPAYVHPLNRQHQQPHQKSVP